MRKSERRSASVFENVCACVRVCYCKAREGEHGVTRVINKSHGPWTFL